MTRQFSLLLLLFLATLAGCRQAETPLGTPTAAPATPPAVPSPTSRPRPTMPSPTRPPASPTPPPATPTAAPLTMAVGPGVPAAVIAAAELLAGDRPDIVLTGQPAAVTLSVAGERPLATWTYALVAPFPTFTDGLTLEEVQQLWQEGSLFVDAETNALLEAAWGAPEQPAIIVPAGELVSTLWATQTGYEHLVPAVVPFEQLVPQLKVLAVDGVSPVAPTFDPAGYPLSFTIGLSGDEDSVALVRQAWGEPLTNRDDSRITHVALTGPAGMRRAVADRMERYSINYPGEETGPVLQVADIAHMSNENAFASDCPLPDPNDSVNVCNRDEYVELMTWMGIDVNEMTGNHLNDWGPQALLHTFDLYEERGIRTFGGGRDLAHARESLLLEHNGNQIAFVGCNPVGPPLGWAAEAYPGALPCDDYSFITAEIARLRAAGYLVIATLQYLEDYQYAVLDEQRQAFGRLADAGATVVSGSHAHHPQGFAFRNDAFIHYGLGNLLADQMWSLGSRQMFIDTYLFYDGRLLTVDLWTGINEDYARVRQMTAEERRDLLQAVFAASDWFIFP